MEQLDDAEPDVLSRPVAPAAPGLDTIVSRRQSTSNGRGTPDSDGFGFSEFEGLEPLVPPEEAAAAALTEAAAAAAAATETAALGDGGSAGGAGGLHHHRAHRRSARSLGVPPVVNMSQRPSMRLSDQDPGHHGLAALPAMTAQAVAAAAAARAHAGSSGLPGPRTGSYDVIVSQAPLQPTEEEAMEVDQEDEPAQAADSSSAPGARTSPAAALSRRSSRANSGGATAAGSPRQSGTAASTRSASGSMNDGSRRSSKRSIPSIFQAAAAVAAAAEAAAAAAVGFALGGKDRTASEQQQPMDASPALPMDEVATQQQQQQQQQAEQLREESVTANSFLRQRLAGDGLGSGFGSVDSFTCPAFMPLAGSITATGGRPSSSANGSAGSSSNGSMQQGSTMPGVGNTPAAPAAAALPAHTAAMAAAAAAAMVAEGDRGMPGLYGSPAANLGSYAGGSPSAAQAALLRRQQLAGSEGSEWGSGALGSHLHLSTSGIDSPTGSAVFRLGGNSPHPLDTCDSAGGGGASVPPGELSAALESLAVQTGCSTGGSKPIGIGASRMAREAAAAAAGGCNGSAGPVGAAALLVGTRGLTGLGVKGSPGLSEITPAADDDDPGEDRIGAKYPSDSGNNQPAGAVFFRLAGDLAPGATKIASPAAEVVVGEQQPVRRSSSSGGGAAVSKVLGKVLIGPAGLLTRPPRQADSTGSEQGGQGAAAGAAVAVASSRGASTTSDTAAVGLSSDVRQSARLGAAAAAAALAGAAACADVAPAAAAQQQQHSDAGAQPPSTGLVRRTPHTSRAPSQSLQLGLLGGSSFHYGDECDGQALMRGSAVSSAGQVSGGVLKVGCCAIQNAIAAAVLCSPADATKALLGTTGQHRC